MHLREVVRNLKFVKEVKASQWWLNHAQKVGGNQRAPKGWVRPKMPQFNAWKVDPKIADVLDDFYKPGIFDIPAENMLREINQFATSSMFWNPIGHMQNVGVHWSVARGWDWIRPSVMRHFATDMTRAIKATVTQNHDYQRFLRQGGGLVYGGVKNADFYGEMARHMGMEIEKNWSQYQSLFKKLGISKPAEAVAWWYGKMRETLWASSDMFMMHRYLELERKGMSPMRAMKEAEKHIPNYRIPAEVGSKVLGERAGRLASMTLQEPALTNFARYHYGMWKSFMNMATDLAKGTPAEKKEALGNIAALAFMGYVAYPVVNAIYQKITGDPNARMLARGAMSVPHGLAEVSRDRESFSQFLQSNITMAPATKEILQQFFGKDFFTGREMGGAVPRIEHAAKSLLSPYGTANQLATGDEDARSAGRTVLDTIVGGENTSEKAEHGKQYGAELRAKEERRHEKKPQGLIEQGYYGAKKAIMGEKPEAPKVEKAPKAKRSHHNKAKWLLMFGEVPDHIRKRHEKDVPSLGNLDALVLPSSPVRYVEAEIIEKPRAAVLDSSAVLDNITNKALTRLDEILEGEWSGDPKEDAIMMDAVRLTLTTQLRVDDSRLAKRTNDTLAELLKRMEQEDVRLMKVVG